LLGLTESGQRLARVAAGEHGLAFKQLAVQSRFAVEGLAEAGNQRVSRLA
jgi:hypothetical protein